MPDTDEFDAFYKGAREPLLLQTYLLTGDLPVARSAVREAFVVAWHHWPKISALHDPQAEVRSRAWAIAQRRATARPWHKEKGLDEGVAGTLSALHDLDTTPRRMIILAESAGLALGEASREVGITLEEGARHLAVGRAEFADSTGSSTPTGVEDAFAAVGDYLADGGWQRPSILRRAGTRRRRIHTVIGVGVAVGAVALAGVVVQDSSGTPTSLARSVERTPSGAQEDPSEEAAERFSADLMLTSEEVRALAPETTFSGDMTDNTGGDGLVLPCQQSRYADVDGLAGYLSSFGSAQAAEPGPVAAYQFSELSRDAEGAATTYATWRDWFAGCDIPRSQVLETLDVTGVGEEAAAFVIAVPGDPSRVVTTGVARTGDVTTVVASEATSATADTRDAVAALLGIAVDKLCARDDDRACSTTPAATGRLPFPVGETPAMLNLVDLPPVSGVPLPWLATRATTASANDAATVCDRTGFESTTDPLTRTFVISDANLPDTFGLTQTNGTVADAATADAFVAAIAEKMTACQDQDLVTSVEMIGDASVDDGRVLAWRLQVRADDNQTVSILMGAARAGNAVTQVGFVPAAEADLDDETFVGIVTRAQQRLAVAVATAAEQPAEEPAEPSDGSAEPSEPASPSEDPASP